ncbi:N-acetylglucosamine-6-phosphate deacetylase [Pseudogemmobacter blasticus]|uniref:N-acetylglucosamine-6-phosphate deacetylase n=1 Tax=Fuscovulum blasticum DSM 2131 TaxID=1188250 RepID=A0A2T4JFC3_FUSBL|nr:N-acetylglucosamine-6-phosphate deacetylase [Fuscovulum blasticum]PTE16611.1 N-acetylglucosamine-6-phosphate deacetylase [Fuscovulum blasticum DSM 2131]
MPIRYTGAALFDGTRLHPVADLTVADGKVTDSAATETVFLSGGYLLPGLLDLQVNGAGGQMISGRTTPADLRAFCETHARLGATGVLPTLITDTAEATAALIDAAAGAAGTPGLLGLHLEGPHLDPRRKGAHDPALIRPMTDDDLNRLCEGRKRLPALLVTVAPASVTPEQIATLTRAGVIVSLGHSDCTHAEAQAAIAAGARCVTHLFNAMSQLQHREPGLVGAALEGGLNGGLIADGHHVHPAAMRVALAANPAGLYLVTDAMAVAGTDQTEFTLGGRRILRRDGRLTLEDGTLAGADLTLPQAIGNLVAMTGTLPETAFAMATSRPAAVLGRADLGHLQHGAAADFVHLGADFSLQGVWRAGARLI